MLTTWSVCTTLPRRGQSALAVDKQGQVHVLYVSYEDGNWSLDHATLFHMVRSPGPDGIWWNPLKVCDQPGADGQDVCAVGMDTPDLILLPDGKIMGMWSEDRFFAQCPGNPTDWCYQWGVYEAVYENGNWGPHIKVDDTWYQGTRYERDGGRFSLSVDGAGKLYAVWEDEQDSAAAVRFSTRLPGSNVWQPSVPISGRLKAGSLPTLPSLPMQRASCIRCGRCATERIGRRRRFRLPTMMGRVGAHPPFSTMER